MICKTHDENTPLTCAHCEEPIIRGEELTRVPGFDSEPTQYNFHRNCFLRTITGSVAHQQKLCCCYVRGSSCNDDPALTVRQAANAAAELFSRNQQRAEQPGMKWHTNPHTVNLFTIYKHPTDHPNSYVVRRFELDQATSEYALAPTLELARALIPPSADQCIAHDPSDDCKIVETWV